MRFVSFFVRFFMIVMFLVVPIGAYIQVRNNTMVEGHQVKRLEQQVLVLKKKINNLEQELAEQIDYKRIEKLARQRDGLAFIYENRNPVIVVRESTKK